MNDDVTYLGENKTTHAAEECTKLMEDLLLGYVDTSEIEPLHNEVTIRKAYLNKQDELTLIKYAPLLFTTLPLEHDLHDVMLELIERVNLRCNNIRVNNFINEKVKNNYTHKNKSSVEKCKTLQNHIDGIFGLIGKNRLSKDLYNSLTHLYENAGDYVFLGHGLTFSAKNKEPIREYLKNLGLYQRTKKIDEFISKLK